MATCTCRASHIERLQSSPHVRLPQRFGHSCRCTVARAASTSRDITNPPVRGVQADVAASTSADNVSSSPTSGRPVSLRSYNISLWDAMKFGGPAPHIINKRLAMLGFLWGAKLEFQTGQTIVDQAVSRPVLVAAVVALTTWASLIPITKGAKSEAFGKFSPKAEIVNGRAACLGFAILLVLESKAQVPFF